MSNRKNLNTEYQDWDINVGLEYMHSIKCVYIDDKCMSHICIMSIGKAGWHVLYVYIHVRPR